MDNLYPCCMALLFFSSHMSIYLKNCWQWFLSIYEKLESIITVSHKVHFWGFFFIFYFVWGRCFGSTWHIRFTMLILPFFIIKRMKSRAAAVSPYSGGHPGSGPCLVLLSFPSLPSLPSHSHLPQPLPTPQYQSQISPKYAMIKIRGGEMELYENLPWVITARR